MLDDKIFKDFDFGPLESLDGRITCDKCGTSVKYFCYYCLIPLVPLPQVSLPIPLTILKDEREKDGKSTAIHAALLAPSSTRVLSINVKEGIPEDIIHKNIDESSVILFPGKDSVDVGSIDWGSVKSIIVIDGTWSQAASINRLSQLGNIKRVHLCKSHRTLFWRYQNLGEHCLSTIEATYYLYQEIVAKHPEFSFLNSEILLYLFVFFYKMIQQSYKKDPESNFTAKHRPNYITK